MALLFCTQVYNSILLRPPSNISKNDHQNTGTKFTKSPPVTELSVILISAEQDVGGGREIIVFMNYECIDIQKLEQFSSNQASQAEKSFLREEKLPSQALEVIALETFGNNGWREAIREYAFNYFLQLVYTFTYYL